MQDKKKYKEQSDDFSNLIRHRLENHRMSVDDDCWNEIESQLKPKKRPMMWWLAGSVAAVAVMVLFWVLYPSGETLPGEVTVLHVADTTSLKRGEEQKEDRKQPVEDIKIKESVVSPRLISQKARETVSSQTNSSEIESNAIGMPLIEVDTVNLAIVDVDKIPLDTIENNMPGIQAADSTPSIPKKSEPWIKKEPSRLLVAKKEKRDKWLLAAAVSSGGNISIGNKSYDNAYFTDLTSSAPNRPSVDLAILDFSSKFEESNVLSPSDFTNINHSLPLSFGVTVRKDINRYVGLETGLVYTYLSSRFQKGGSPSYQAKQELHYLGIPVNLVVYLWNSSQWNIYLSGGVMAEKGLRRNFSQDMHRNNDPISRISVKEGIDGIQWSLNASIGVSYRFYHNWGVYFEPRYSYFYNNNQPISIRTENPRVFGLNTGFRYQF